jgi:uncharacterized membrane protein
MSETYNWVMAVHVIGFLMWAGTLMSCLFLLLGHQSVKESGRSALAAIERKVAIVMDASALVAIVAGLYLALGFSFNASPGKGGGSPRSSADSSADSSAASGSSSGMFSGGSSWSR